MVLNAQKGLSMDSDKKTKFNNDETDEMETIPLDPVGTNKGKPITFKFSTTLTYRTNNQITMNNLSDSQEVISDCCFCTIS